MIKYQEELNRNWNREICKNFDEMAGKLGEIPDDTKVNDILVMVLIVTISKKLHFSPGITTFHIL